VFENIVLRRTFRHKREEVTKVWGNMFNEELHNLHSAPDITTMIKLKGIRWAWNVTCMGQKCSAYEFLVRKQKGRDNL
jgi:hypothetical protein